MAGASIGSGLGAFQSPLLLLHRVMDIVQRYLHGVVEGVKKPGNYLVAIGTPLRFVLEQVGFTGSVNQLIFGLEKAGKL